MFYFLNEFTYTYPCVTAHGEFYTFEVHMQWLAKHLRRLRELGVTKHGQLILEASDVHSKFAEMCILSQLDANEVAVGCVTLRFTRRGFYSPQEKLEKVLELKFGVPGDIHLREWWREYCERRMWAEEIPWGFEIEETAGPKGSYSESKDERSDSESGDEESGDEDTDSDSDASA